MEEVLEAKKFKAASANVNPENEKICPADLPPEEIVFSIDHILAQVFSLLDTPDLYACRLVSHRFLHFARRPLEKRIRKHFHYKGPKSRIGVDSSGRTFAQLISFLEHSASVSESSYNLLSFPCTNFCIFGPQLGDRTLQKFFNIYGQRIEKLEIFPYKPDKVHENIRMKQLCKLLTIQAPHLERLCLAMFPTVEWHQGIPIQGFNDEDAWYRSRNSVLLKTDPEFEQISAGVESSPRTSSLKILHIYGDGLSKTIEWLLQLSPKLQQVVVRRGVIRRGRPFICTYDVYRHLLEPVYRIHLLQSLVFQPVLQAEKTIDGYHYSCFNMEKMEKISLDNNLRLRELKIDFCSALPLCKADPEFENQVVVLINRILEGSKDSLVRLHLYSFTFIRGLKMPMTMPNVQEMEIGHCGHKNFQNLALFPKGFSLAKTFSRLTIVKLVGAHSFRWNDFYFQNYLNFGDDEEGAAISLGVKKVILNLGFVNRGYVTTIPARLHEDIQKFFPSASIEIAKHTSYCFCAP